MEKIKQTLIVDFDILAFTICRVTEDVTDFGDQQMESFDEEATVRLLEQGLDDIGELTGYSRENIICAMSSDTNFRKKFFPTYKSNRKNVKKPVGLPWLRQYMQNNAEKYQLFMVQDLEADDLMGMAGTDKNSDNVAIYSLDKDLRTIPVRQWCFKEKKFWVPTELQAVQWLYTQVLTGDTVDGYKGCPRIGKVKSSIALAGCTNELELLEKTFTLYWNVYKDEAKEKLLEQIGQARILHSADYITLVNFDKTYNPFEIMNVSSELLDEWVENFKEKQAENKKVKHANKKRH